MKNVSAYLKANRARLLPLLILAFMAVATFFTLTLSQRRQEIRQQAAQNDNAQLTFGTPNPASVTPGNEFTVPITMSAASQTTYPVTGADIIVQFDQTKLTLQNITQNTAAGNPYKTYAPVTCTDGMFRIDRVKSCANNGSYVDCQNVTQSCSVGKVEFGIVSFDWTGNALTSPSTGTVLSPVATLTFQVKTGAAAGASTLSFVNTGVTGTTDSNIVIIPTGSDPEDILAAPGYTNSTVSVTISGTASPAPTPSTAPRPTPTPSSTACATPTPSMCNACYNFNASTDGKVDVLDVQTVAGLWNKKICINTEYNTKYDVYCGTGLPTANPDGTINVLDIQMVASKWNQTSCIPQ